MKTVMLIAAGISLAGCAVAEQSEIGSATEALDNVSNSEPFCPGGKSPACAVCSSGKCIDACFGSYSCNWTCGVVFNRVNTSGATVAAASCRTSSVAPIAM